MSEGELLALQHGPPDERLRAARRLLRTAARPDLDALKRIRQEERDAWVQFALDQAIRRVDDGAGAPEPEPGGHGDGLDASLLDDVRAQATASVTATFMHEINPLVGRIEAVARAEVPNYDEGKTAQAISRLKGLMEALRLLHEASKPPQAEDLDLTELIHQAGYELTVPNDVELVLVRDDPVAIVGDSNLIRLPVANALRNAIEACLAAPKREEVRRVVVNWGTTDQDVWVSVLDDGCGLPEGFDKVWEAGRTNKSRAEHYGMGLSIARAAAASVRGRLTLRPRESGGSAFEMRWPLERD